MYTTYRAASKVVLELARVALVPLATVLVELLLGGACAATAVARAARDTISMDTDTTMGTDMPMGITATRTRTGMGIAMAVQDEEDAVGAAVACGATAALVQPVVLAVAACTAAAQEVRALVAAAVVGVEAVLAGVAAWPQATARVVDRLVAKASTTVLPQFLPPPLPLRQLLTLRSSGELSASDARQSKSNKRSVTAFVVPLSAPARSRFSSCLPPPDFSESC